MRPLLSRTMLAASVLILVAASPSDLATSPSPVADAARDGDRLAVRDLLRQGGDVNAAQGDGMTALHWAAIANDVEMVEMLLYAGANVKATTRLGAYTPLVLASRHGNAEAVQVLLDAGADANAVTTTGVTPLMLAAASGSVDAVQSLLERDADVSATEPTRGQTALMFAAAFNRHDAARMLLERGADPGTTTKTLAVPELSKEAEEAFRKRLEDLKKQREAEAAAEVGRNEETSEEAPGETDDADETGRKGRNVFAKIFGWMIPGGGTANEDEEERRGFRRTPYGELVGAQGGMTALLLAAREGHRETVAELLDAGADVNQTAEGSKTSPVLIATMNGHFDLAAYLLERGADPNLAGEPSGVTPLYAVLNLTWAPRSGYPQPTAHKQQKMTHLELMKVLLDKGAEPDTRLAKKVWFTGYNFDRSGVNEVGATPFWRAAYGSDVAAMRLLRSYGADVSLPTTNPGLRPRVGNQQGREIKDVSNLPPVPVGGPALTPLHAASGAGYGEGFAANDHRNHPAGFMPAVRYLVEECGADVNARDHEGNTPLHNAAARGDVEMIEYLVAKGANITAVNREGQTTADMANGPVQRIQPFPEALELLVSLGATNNHNCVSC